MDIGAQLAVCRNYKGILTTSSGGMVNVAGTVYIDRDNPVNMATGGLLVLSGEAEESISEFLDLVEGTDAIRYCDTTLPGWLTLPQRPQALITR